MSLFWGEPKKRRTKKRRGQTAYRKGQIGETKASKFLRRRGYKPIVNGRLRTRAGEFDRIMRSPQGRKVAVEVKNLSSPVQASSVQKFGRKVGQEKKHGMVSGGVMVSKSGYSSDAHKVAREQHIKLIKYAPPQEKEKPVAVRILTPRTFVSNALLRSRIPTIVKSPCLTISLPSPRPRPCIDWDNRC